MTDESARTGTGPGAGIDALLASLAQALQEARVAASERRPDEAISALDTAHGLREAIRGSGARFDTAGVSEPFNDLLDELEGAASTLLEGGGADEAAAARLLPVLRNEARLLRRVARALAGIPARDEMPFLLHEIRDLERGLEAETEAPGVEGLDDDEYIEPEIMVIEVAALRDEILDVRARRQLEAAAAVQGAEDVGPRDLLVLVRLLERTRRELQYGRASASSVLDAVVAEKARLLDMFEAWARAPRTSADRDELSLDALAAAADLDEVRTEGWNADDEAEIDQLDVARMDGERLARAWKFVLRQPWRDATPAIRARESRSWRRLRRARRRLTNLWSERVLSKRLSGVFGEAMVRRWDTLIFWLIIAVVGLILVDDSAVEGPNWTTLADTVICCFLLCDFFVRLALTPNRGRWFWRHFLTELLPSIPFALLTSMSAFDHIRWLRWLRLFRAPLRAIRLARPVIRVVQLFLFVVRAIDRMVERYRFALDRDIVFFSDPSDRPTRPAQLERARDLDGWVQRGTGQLFTDLPVEARIEGARWWSRLLGVESRHSGLDRLVAPAARASAGTAAAALDVDDVIELMRGIDDDQVAELIGTEVARQLTASLRFFRLPLLRRLPLVSFVVGRSGAPDPLVTTARLCNLLGGALALARSIIEWLGDLYGSVTGPQVLDRLGLQLVKATSRPAKRLILFGAIMGLVTGLVWMLTPDRAAEAVPVTEELIDFDEAQRSVRDWLRDVARGLERFLAVPALVLGGLCLIPLLLGLWLRRVAGEAADFYDRVADAQFLALTEIAKEDHAIQNLDFLTRRVVLPEVLLEQDLDDDAQRDILAFVSQHAPDLPMPAEVGGRAVPSIGDSGIPWSRFDLMLLFYREFIDGAFFHRNDTKVANLLVGNLTLESIRAGRLHATRRERKRLQSLDIGRGKGGVRGPFVWFNFITHSVAQHTARLVLEYNHHCIPLDEMESVQGDERRAYEAWLDEREGLTVRRATGKAGVVDLDEPDETKLVFRSTGFNALHFLTGDDRRDEYVRRRYGERVADLLAADRESLIRVTFGTYPIHELPVDRRTFNPFVLYARYCARGKVVWLLPPVLALRVVGLLWLGIKKLVSTIRDLLDPARIRRRPRGRAGFDVARRKIFRMRRPVVLHALEFRARFDFEYLGLEPTGIGRGVVDGDHVADDLVTLHANEREWQVMRELKADRQREIRRLTWLLRRWNLFGPDFETELLKREPTMEGRTGEAGRAVVLAFLCDHQGIRSVIDAVHQLGALIRRLSMGDAAPGRLGAAMPKARITMALGRLWPVLAPEAADDANLRRKFLLVAASDRKIRRLLFTLNEHLPADTDPERFAIDVLMAVAERPGPWTEQIVAIRTAQTLGMLDLMGYEHLIRKLGRYGTKDGRRRTTRTARL